MKEHDNANSRNCSTDFFLNMICMCLEKVQWIFSKERRAAAFCLLFVLLCAAMGCSRESGGDVKRETGSQIESADKKVNVLTTIFPQYDFVRQIAGDKVNLQMLLKPGEESHSYEPTPQDIIAIQNCDLFIYVGGENDAWVEEILSSMDGKKLTTLCLLDCVNAVQEEHVDGMKEKKTKHDDEEYDEHVWTAPENAEKIVNKIAQNLSNIDSENETFYRENAESYDEKLALLDQQFETVVSGVSRKPLLFGDRFPFRYFADAYGLQYYAAFPGCASDTEPSAETMAFLINQVKEKNIPVVLKMELSNENIANAIAETTQTKVRVFYSCHNITAEQFAQGETYVSLMEANVETLKEALGNGTD